MDGATYSYTARNATQFESGRGTYDLAGNKIVRATVEDGSSGTGIKVNFTSAPTVILTPLADDLPTDFREILTVDRKYYVDPAGSNSNPGTALLPWATLAYATQFVSTALDVNCHVVEIRGAPGTYTHQVTCGDLLGAAADAQFTRAARIIGDETTPSNVVISVTDAPSPPAPLRTGRPSTRYTPQ